MCVRGGKKKGPANQTVKVAGQAKGRAKPEKAHPRKETWLTGGLQLHGSHAHLPFIAIAVAIEYPCMASRLAAWKGTLIFMGLPVFAR